MKIGAWNIGNQAGNRRIKAGTAEAILHLECDLVVISEYCPGEHHMGFVESLRAGGLSFPVAAIADEANGILIASRHPLRELEIRSPELDRYSPVAAKAVQPKDGPCILGLRVPYWTGTQLKLCAAYWDWIEATAEWLKAQGPSLIIGDLNVKLQSASARGGDHFRRILHAGWTRANPAGTSLSGYPDGHQIDHALLTENCVIRSAQLISEVRGHMFCDGPTALSDHAALVVDFQYPGEPDDHYLYELVDSVPPLPGERERVQQTLRDLGLSEEDIQRIT